MLKRTVLYLLTCLVLLAPVVSAQDREGSEDHPLITRYPGSTIVLYHHQSYGEFTIPTGPFRGNRMNTYESVSGELTRLMYKIPKERSAAEVFRNYERALKESGFQIIFQAVGKKELGATPRAFKVKFSHPDKFPDDDKVFARSVYGNCIDGHYLAARSPQGVTVALFVALSQAKKKKVNLIGHPLLHLEIIESEKAKTGLVTVTAQEHYQEITETGSSSLPSDVLFDVDKFVLKPDASKPLEEAAKLLQEHPQMELFVTGHTDTTGGLEHNMELSLKRAQAVVNALTQKHGIATSRLQARGLGPLAPVATNSTPEGRQKNRRVEFVAR